MPLLKNKYFRIFSIIYILIFLIPYAIIPYVYVFEQVPEYVTLLIILTIISIFSYLLTFNIPFGSTLIFPKRVLNFNTAINFLFIIFLLLAFIIFATAQKIPIIESFRGASSDDLSIYREDFLKNRQGWEASLGYIMGGICGAALPYFIALAFQRNHKYKFLFGGLFLLYSISFLQKAYFTKLAIPLFVIYLYKSKNKSLFIVYGLITIITIVAAMYIFAGTDYSDLNEDTFFSSAYRPSGILDSIVWRAVVIPVVTALDGLQVFLTELKGQFLYGNTSTFIAFITGGERVNFERLLYQYQFGGSETGNANQFFVIEAYVNFGIIGVILFSLVVGKLMRFVIKIDDIVAISILPVFMMNLFTSGLIGSLLSDGFLLFFMILRYLRFK